MNKTTTTPAPGQQTTLFPCAVKRPRKKPAPQPPCEFKVNNNFTPYYARLFAEKYPEYADRFEFRNLDNPKTAAEFQQFHQDNPNIWALYVKFAFQLIRAGRRRLGSKMIIERIRFETAVKTINR